MIVFDQFRELNPDKDWSFFDKDFAISKEDREKVFALSTLSAEALWCHQISDDLQCGHMMYLSKDHWLQKGKQGPNCLADEEAGSDVELFLQQHFQSILQECFYFMLMRETAYHTPVDVFIKNWRAFLVLDDEGPILLHPPSGLYAFFGPHGRLCAGRR